MEDLQKKVLRQAQDKAKLVRKWCLISTTEAGSGHPTSCLSAADIGTVLFDKYFRFDIKDSKNPANDRFFLSKGHAAPLLYTLFAMSGGLKLEELKTLRKIDSRLEGHPTLEFPFAEVVTGSLGQGLSIGAGNAVVAKKGKLDFKTFVLLGDGELAEGSNWEAANFASYYGLDNLIAIVDINRLGQSQATMFEHNIIEEYIPRFSAFGWEVIAIDGHNLEEVDKALKLATENKSGKPFVILAKTYKGKGISFLENKDGWHGKALKKEDLEKALKELGEVDDGLRFALKQPNVILGSEVTPGSLSNENDDVRDSGQARMTKTTATPKPMPATRVDVHYKLGEEIATREVYGQVLAELGKQDERIYALDAEVKNSTYSMDFQKAFPDRFIECFIAEQNMVGVALGLSNRGKVPFVSTFAAFLTRGFDQIRMAAVSYGNISFCGSHAGVSIGEDGASQMGLEDITMFGVLPGSVVLHPADAVSTAKLLPEIASHEGISYLRTLRPKTPVIYDTDESFAIGGSKILRSAQNDILTIVAAGITVFEALKAYDELEKEGISVRVVDCYSIKPIDKKTLQLCISETMHPHIITVEDHFTHGGLGDFVLDAVSDTNATVTKLAVREFSHSGLKDELLDRAGISAKHIVSAVKKIVIDHTAHIHLSS